MNVIPETVRFSASTPGAKASKSVENCVEPVATRLSMAISNGLGVAVLVAVGVGVLFVTDAEAAGVAIAGRGKLAETEMHNAAASPACNKTNSLGLYLAFGALVMCPFYTVPAVWGQRKNRRRDGGQRSRLRNDARLNDCDALHYSNIV